MTLEKEKKAIEILKSFEPPDEAYYLCYSGGKDSDAIKILAVNSGVKFEAHHCLTTMDAPETVQYIKSHSDVQIDLARYKDGNHKTILNLIPIKRMAHTRKVRYCCSELKKWGGKDKLKITGVRSAESVNRKNNGGIIKILGKPKTMLKKAEEQNLDYIITPKGGLVLNNVNYSNSCFAHENYKKVSVSVNPINDWTEDDVWEYLHYYGCEGNPLYQCGYKRIGCVGCPMASKAKRIAEFKRYPVIMKNYLNAFTKMLALHENPRYPNAVAVMEWWLELNPTEKAAFELFLSEIGVL